MPFQHRRYLLSLLTASLLVCHASSTTSGLGRIQQLRGRSQENVRSSFAPFRTQNEESAVRERNLRWNWSKFFKCLGPVCGPGGGHDTGSGGSGSRSGGSGSSSTNGGGSGSSSSTSSSSSSSSSNSINGGDEHSGPSNFSDKMKERFSISTGGFNTAGVVASLTALLLVVIASSGYGIAMFLLYATRKRDRDGLEVEDSFDPDNKESGEHLKGAVARRFEKVVLGKESVFPLTISGAPRFVGLKEPSPSFPKNTSKSVQTDELSEISATCNENSSAELSYQEMEEAHIELSSPSGRINEKSRSLEVENAPADNYIKMTDDNTHPSENSQKDGDGTPCGNDESPQKRNCSSANTTSPESLKGEAISNYFKLSDQLFVGTTSALDNEIPDKSSRAESSTSNSSERATAKDAEDAHSQPIDQDSGEVEGESKTMRQLKLVQRAKRILRELKL